jgi:hypothetical protein
VLYSSNRNCEINGHYVTDNSKLPKNRRVKVRFQMPRRPSVSGSLITLRGIHVSGPVLNSKPEELANSWVISISEQQMAGFLNGNAGLA